MTHNPIQQYRRVDTCGDVENANPHKLIDMLYGGLKSTLIAAQGSMSAGLIAEKGQSLGKALDILQALQMGLNPQAGGTIADNLGRLYEYMERRITEVNLHNDERGLEELLNLAESMREAWVTIPVDQRQGPVAA